MPSGEYGWPLQVARCMLSITFVSTAIAKLRTSGLDWVFSSNIGYTICRCGFLPPDSPSAGVGPAPLTLGPLILPHPWISETLAAGTILIELLHPLSLFSKRARMVLVPGGVFLLATIPLAMGFFFPSLLALNLFWVPWSRVVRGLRMRLHPAATTTVQ